MLVGYQSVNTTHQCMQYVPAPLGSSVLSTYVKYCLILIVMVFILRVNCA